MASPLLDVRGLRVDFDLPQGRVPAVRGVELRMERGGTLALVGSSGSGKSTTALALLDLVPYQAESVRLDGQELRSMPAVQRRAWLSARVGVVFQEPGMALNPVLTIGRQLREVFEAPGAKLPADEAKARIRQSMDDVRLPDAEHLLERYPHQLSGGMQQRVMLAMALLRRPLLLIADEPTSALDATTQAQLLSLLRGLQERRGMALLLITHDFGVVAGLADDVAVMQDGRIVEKGSTESLFAQPRHPATQALLDAASRHTTAVGLGGTS